MNDFEMMQKSFTKTIDAYGCLGIMRVNAGNKPISFFAHSQMTSALNWLHCSRLTFSYKCYDTLIFGMQAILIYTETAFCFPDLANLTLWF